MEQVREILERFIAWTKVKFSIQTASSKAQYFHEREIWWTHLGANVGSEQDGKGDFFDRPVLIVKTFSQNLFLGAPLTTAYHDYALHIRVTNVILGAPDYVVLSQLRTMSSRRLIKKQRMLSMDEFSLIRRRLREMF